MSRRKTLYESLLEAAGGLAFTYPDGDDGDPSDAERQSMGRPATFPYDSAPVYGKPVGTSGDMSSYQSGPVLHPKDERTPWEQLEALTSPGCDRPPRMGIHSSMGDGLDPEELNIDALRQDFRQSFQDTLPKAQSLGRKGLFALLVQLDPDYSAELFAPDEDEEMQSIYGDWGQHVYAPGAEFDTGTEYEETPPDEDFVE